MKGEKHGKKFRGEAMGQDAQARGRNTAATSRQWTRCHHFINQRRVWAEGRAKSKARGLPATILKSDHGGSGGASLKTDNPPRSQTRAWIHRRRRQRGTTARIEDPLQTVSHHLLDANPENGVHCLPLNLPLTALWQPSRPGSRGAAHSVPQSSEKVRATIGIDGRRLRLPTSSESHCIV